MNVDHVILSSEIGFVAAYTVTAVLFCLLAILVFLIGGKIAVDKTLLSGCSLTSQDNVSLYIMSTLHDL